MSKMKSNAPSFGVAGRADAVKQPKTPRHRGSRKQTHPHPFKHGSSGVKTTGGVVDRTGVQTGSK